MDETKLIDSELQMLLNNKETGFNYKERREDAWRENYELGRDEVQVNRLIQRQSVNLPLMKTYEQTILKENDDMPVIEFENLDNDKEAQIFLNEIWRITLDENNAEIQDIVDKKQDFYFGRTFDSWQIEDGKIVFDIEDTEDILVDRFMNPYDIDSSRFLIHTHIFRPLSYLIDNSDYDQVKVQELKTFFETQLGIVKAQDNENTLMQKNQKLSDLGVPDVEEPLLGETYVELTMHFVFRSDFEKDGKVLPEQIIVFVEAEDQVILMKKPQEEIMGTTKDHYWRNHYRYNTWGDDVDKQDFWTNGKADIIRTPNKVVNAWFSQEVERRTLSNFGMTFFDSSKASEGYMPNTFQPAPFGFYPFPGNPNEGLKRVEIPMNDGNLESMNFISGFLEKATGATPGMQGVNPPAGTPLGTTQIVEASAQARVKGMSKFYTHCWKQRAMKFLKLIEGAPEKIDMVKIYKKGRNTDDFFAREVAPKDYMTESGYNVRVWSQEEKKANDTDKLTKLDKLYLMMPDNPKVRDIYQRKLTEFADLPPEDVNAIMEFEKTKPVMPNVPQIDPKTGQPIQPSNPLMNKPNMAIQ
jgi:hypothetical protein